MSENKSARRCGAEQLTVILAHGRMESEAHDYVKHVLGDPPLSGYAQGDDIPEEIVGVEECLAYIRRVWKKVGTADGLLFQLQSQLPDDGDAEPSEEPPNEEPEDIPVEDDNPEDGKPIVDTPKVHGPLEKNKPAADGVTAVEEDRGQPDSFRDTKPRGRTKRAK